MTCGQFWIIVFLQLVIIIMLSMERSDTTHIRVTLSHTLPNLALRAIDAGYLLHTRMGGEPRTRAGWVVLDY
jgi:hypothetical protein